MAGLVCYDNPTDAGQDLLDNWVRPVCRARGVPMRVAKPTADRRSALAHQVTARFVLWDCSVEGSARVYRALPLQAKMRKKNLFVSRTPLPRNVLTFHQCAPVHGHALPNSALGAWLDRHLFDALTGRPTGHRPPVPNLAGHYWMFDDPADRFLSFRGTHQHEAEQLRDILRERHGESVRMVPASEYSYPTEVVTGQQMWEGVARLRYEIQATGAMIVFLTDDYFDSFWTASELLLALWVHGWEGWAARPVGPARDRPGWKPLTSVEFTNSPQGTGRLPLREAMRAFDIPGLGPEQMDRLAHLINNSDPLTTAPETQVAPNGPARLVARAVRRLGYYLPELTAAEFWHTVRVPCPVCKQHRNPADVDWSAHLTLADSTPRLDYFGYFPATREALGTGTIRCPGCRSDLHVVNDRGVRTQWVPVMSTEPDQDRPVIQEHRVWEVLGP